MSRTPTSHTVDMAQIAALNTLLADHPVPGVTASDLGLDGAAVRGSSSGALAGSAVLVRLCWDGAPEFPDIHGHFADEAGSAGSSVVDLHTAALSTLSHQLHARHVWGQGSIPGTPPP